MRMGGFIVGGIVGMAAAAYLSKNRPGVISWMGSTTGDIVSNMRDKMMGGALNQQFGGMNSKAGSAGTTAGGTSFGNAGASMQTAGSSHTGAGTSKSSTAKASSKDSKSWNTIEMMVNSDPEVKRQADEVLASSSSPATH